jgi:predicted ribosome quality control (RQC) complex YloA/Tae2 family protein
MNPLALALLAEAWTRTLAGSRIRRPCRPDPWCLGLELKAGGTLGFGWKPGEAAAAMCDWGWPRGAVSDLLRIRIQGARIVSFTAIPDEPILRVRLEGDYPSELVLEGVGRSSNILLLGEKLEILWAARTLAGKFRTGAVGDLYLPPPPREGNAGTPLDPSTTADSLNTDGSKVLHDGLLARGRQAAMKKLARERRSLQRRRSAVLGDLEEADRWISMEPLAQGLLSSGRLDPRGESERLVMDWGRNPPAEVSVALDPALTVLENVEKLFKKVRKGKARHEKTGRVLREIESHSKDLVERESTLAECRDLALLFPRIKSRENGKREPDRRQLPRGVVSVSLPDGFVGFAGKDARGNDAVTFRVGRGNDFWFHAADYPGSHVVVRNPGRLTALPQTVERAAALQAARYSQAPPGNRIEVTSAQCKYLRRVPGAPGRVMVAAARKMIVDLPRE